MIDVLAPMSRPEFEPPWVDLEFEVRSAAWLDDPSRLRLECQGLAEDLHVGFGVDLRRDGWRRDQYSADIWFDWGRGALFSTGIASDSFAVLLSRLFDGDRACGFVRKLECDVVLLNSDPSQLDQSSCMSKFFIGEPGDDEGQLFVNVDLPRGRVELREKDPEFRAAILRELTVH